MLNSLLSRLLVALVVAVMLFPAGGRCLADGSGTEPESWTDPDLPVSDGLLLWLDASRLNEALDSRGLAPVERTQPVDLWPDGSGLKRDLTQTDETRRPRYHESDGFHAVRFAGEHLLQRSEPGLHRDALTVFIVTATYSNPGPFSAWLSLSAEDGNDYTTGLNLDQGTGVFPHQQVLNVEGVNSRGQSNLLIVRRPYGTVNRIGLISQSGPEGVALWMNGEPQGTRGRTGDAPIRMEEIHLGARRYSNSGGEPRTQNFLDGDIAEVLIFGRALADGERQQVEKYLAAKYGDVPPRPNPNGEAMGKPLVRVENPPLAQVLLPGFTVRELPLDLPNVNNVLYRPDGKLVALGYDGNIWLLSDNDGDGLEDAASLFWENSGEIQSPIGMDLTPPQFADGEGVFVASKGKCSLILDTDRDGTADEERVIAGGWPAPNHRVDALGVAVDPRDGSIYFGRGTPDFTNAYVVDREGEAGYDLKHEQGTIQRVSPDFKTREIVCTGIRFPVGLRFNRDGDLFCTDQEGATWLPNGNPFDELLHIQTGRHYGFPPRHPRHLPDVIDEPSTFDYTPQHQSTCGFCFNEPVAEEGRLFGPDAWQGDAFVTGYSRGKLYRTQLVKTESGYIARNHLFACLSMLPADCCVTPDGGMLVCCHSGGPDWGSGPAGKGTLLKIEYANPETPQPSLVWAASPHEIRIEFDRPVDSKLLGGIASKIEVTGGEYVRAGDRFETLWPGYAVVQAQLRTPRHDVRVHSVQQTPDGRTLVLAKDDLSAHRHYSISLPGIGRPADPDVDRHERQQQPAIDLGLEISGCVASFSRDGEPLWTGWLPCLDLKAARRWTTGSAHHDLLWDSLTEPGELTLTTKLDAGHMLRPVVQPGSSLDHTWPKETVTFEFPDGASIRLLDDHSGDSPSAETPSAKTPAPNRLVVDNAAAGPVPIEVRYPTGGLEEALGTTASYFTNEDDRRRPLQPGRLLLPWLRSGSADGLTEELADIPELEGGSWARGWTLFHDAQAGCAKCHAIDGSGSAIGPDLSNLVHRDYASVMRDVRQPSFAINPDYLVSVFVLKSGRVLTGTSSTIDGKLHIHDAKGETTVIAPDEVDLVQPANQSIMPEGLLKNFSEEQTRDLMTFLLTKGPAMPAQRIGVDPPTPRSIAEVQDVLDGAPAPPEQWRPLRIVLVAGQKDHGPGEHDYPAWLEAWGELLSIGENVEVVKAMEWPEDSEFDKADAMVFYQRGDWTPDRARLIDRFLSRGGGLTYIHWAVDGRGDAPGFAERIGLAWGAGARFRHGPLTIDFESPSHPIARGFRVLKLIDESYWSLTGDLAESAVLGAGIEDGQPRPLFWALPHEKGRVFVSIPGHYSWTFDDPLYRVLLLRGIAWSAGEPVDRFNPLVLPGANIAL